MNRHHRERLWHPSDLFLPIAFSAATLLGRGPVALCLCIALFAVKLCALSASNGLRSSFALQPAIRSVQGSVVIALALQPPGAVIAAALLRFALRLPIPLSIILASLMLNIEHVFYEYLYAVGDDHSATLSRSITALLALAGMLLCSPRTAGAGLPADYSAAWLLTCLGISAAVSLVIGLCMGGGFHPRINFQVLRCAPMSMLQTALYPMLALLLFRFAAPRGTTALPLFVGLTLYESCRTPFRRSTMEAPALNRALLVACALASAVALIHYFVLKNRSVPDIPVSCCAVVLAALCAFALYGRPGRIHA